jgi:hypothetical protein
VSAGNDLNHFLSIATEPEVMAGRADNQIFIGCFMRYYIK